MRRNANVLLLVACGVLLTAGAPWVGAQAPASPKTDERQQMMERHMAQMQDDMAKIKAAKTSAEKDRLIKEHMAHMREHMRMMGAKSASGADQEHRCGKMGDPPQGETPSQHH